MSEAGEAGDVWRALGSPWRRRLLDLLRTGPRTTGELSEALPELSRYAVMQHLGVLTQADLVVVSRRGRHRYNHLNPVPLRRWYEHWVVPLADESAERLLALERHLAADEEGVPMESIAEPDTDRVRTVRIESELSFRSTPERVFAALSGDTLAWFPHSYGEDRTQRVVIEPRVGGAHYEDWGEGRGHLYGHVTEWDPPRRLGLRGRVMSGTLLDTTYDVSADGEVTSLRMSKVAVGPMSEEEASGIRGFGDIANFEDALRALVEK
jgi:DNA-binding transcriptional ArsR family regulator/uncharacterized protein YndB with AHSA1/START domain